MKPILSIIILLVVLCSACRSSCPDISSDPLRVSSADSVRIEYIETVRIDTIDIESPLPAESFSQVIKDSISHLETSLAVSDARILPDGSLSHSLKNKDIPLKSTVTIPVKDTHSGSLSLKYEGYPVPYPVEKIVEAPLSKWQKFRLNSFWILSAALLAALSYIFRKPILRLMCRLNL